MTSTRPRLFEKNERVVPLYRRVNRYPWWVPVAVGAAAVAAASVGAGCLAKGREDIHDLKDAIHKQVALNGPSTPYVYDHDREDRALDMQAAGYALLGVAGAAAVTGLVLWLVRRKYIEHRSPVGFSHKAANVRIRF